MNYDEILNCDIKTLPPSGIRQFFDIANDMQNVISLSIGEPDFTTPWHIRQAGIDSLKSGRTWYTSNSGLKQLREEICTYTQKKLGIEYDYESEALVTVGGSEAIDLAIRTLANQGDEVLIPEPSFVCYKPITIMAKAEPVIIETKEEDNFKLTAKLLEEKITPKSKILILPYPNNPTGAVMRKDELTEIAKVIKKYNLLVVSDEIYSALTYGGEPHISIASIDGMRERTVVIDGFSKAYAMTGWRMGYALGPKQIISQMVKLHQYAIMCAPTMAQYASFEALKNGENDVASMREEYNFRRRFVVKELRKMGFSCFNPEGAFYAFPNISVTGMTSQEFCKELLYKKNVAIIPGDAFGNCGEGYVRISYSYSLKHLKEALKRINEFLNDINV